MSDAQGEITEVEGDRNTQQENSEAKDENHTRSEIREESSKGNTPITTEENNKEKIKSTVDQVKKILEELKEDGVNKIILTGEAGIGKTWTARKICEFMKKNEPIWIYLDKKHDDTSLKDAIARQLGLPTSTDKREEDGEENEKKPKKVKSMAEKIEEKLKAAPKDMKFILVVIDGQVEEMTEIDKESLKTDTIMKKLDLEAGKDKFKFLITRRKDEDGDSSNTSRKHELGPLSRQEALSLLMKNVDESQNDSARQQFTEDNLSKAVHGSSKPAEILMLAGTLNYIAKSNPEELGHAMEVATKDLSQLLRYAYDKEPATAMEVAAKDLSQRLRYAYDKEPATDCMIDCFWNSWHFLRKHGGIHYNELITNWIMEGCLKHTSQIEKTYLEGHKILMELIDYHMLKRQEDNVVVMEGATLNMKQYCRRAYSETADPGLGTVLKDHSPRILEGIMPADGLMKTLCGDKKEKLMLSLLVDGSRLCREVHEAYFGTKQKLNLLAVFSPRLESPEELSIAKMGELVVLMLRGSHLLWNVGNIKMLKQLAVLEISGSAKLKEIPDELFREMSQLRSLDLSGAGITSIPQSFSELTELRRLILKQCSSLPELPRLGKLTKLEVIDLSGCEKFKKIQEKSFRSLEKLQVINFSQTKIEKLPIVKTLTDLKILLLKECNQLAAMRMLKEVTSIKVLDLSGAKNIKELRYDCFYKAENLAELDLSETQIQFLPPDIGNLQKLRLNKCALLKDLPELEGHSGLEELELSGCERLDKLPELTALQNLKKLDLRGCTRLGRLPDLTTLQNLKILDLRDTTNLWSQKLEDSLTQHLKKLRILRPFKHI